MQNIDFETVAVEMKGIVKDFGDFRANDHIDLKVHKGEIHALLGENGAGKSTLMNVLYGLLQPNAGTISIYGEQCHITSPNVAISKNIGMVHQHFMLVEPFTVTQNIILGMEPHKLFGIIDMKAARDRVMEISKRYGLNVDCDEYIYNLSVGMQQRVEILKALYRGAEIFILDEPTAVLTPQEIGELIKIMRELTKQGKTIIIITHKLAEIKECADYCTIIRRGKKIGSVTVEETTQEQLASMMVGREVLFSAMKNEHEPGEPLLEVKNLHVKNNRGIEAVKGLSLEVRRGEILGIAGVDGNGQSELVEALTGLRKTQSGQVRVCGKDVTGQSPRKVFRSGMASIPEDRQRRGLVLEYSVADNMVLERFCEEPYSKRGLLNSGEIIAHADMLIEKFDVRPPNSEHLAGELSGGNQQKVIIAREIDNNPEVLIAAQPTRGLDVGAIEFVHKSLVSQRDSGKAVLLVSLELDEVINLSDRIAVIYEGRIVDIVDAKDADENQLGLLMAGGGARERG